MKSGNRFGQWKFLALSVLLSLAAINVYAQNSNSGRLVNSGNSIDNTTADYYQGAYKISGTSLRAVLHNIIKGHTVTSYDGLYTAFKQTDTKPNGKIWDIYSYVPNGTQPYEFSHGVAQCGNYSGEGQCYNREHSFCDSWLGQTNPARSDLFHMYPTDGYVNNRRSNYNFGKVASATWTSKNGSKLGSSASAGFTGTVFEPIDEFKGDLARSTMYMSVRYYTEDGNFGTSDGTTKSDLKPWYSNQLFEWHVKDTVSQKEIDRNNAIYGIQKNRNPFIDHPEFAAEIWKTDMAPTVDAVKELVDNTVLIDFSRYLDSTSAVNALNYICDKSTGSPTAIQWGVNNDVSKVLITFAKLNRGTDYSISLNNLKSINNVAMANVTVQFHTNGTSAVQGNEQKVKSFRLEQNYPNPFNPSTEINYTISKAGMVTLKVFDAIGHEVAVLVNSQVGVGSHTVTFNASGLPSGVYFYQIRTDNEILTKKMLLAK
ncbi:MAG: endonuclease [Ignavibacteria bacterium]|nr:endonuclease [Ignavibacteria bacterium]